MMQRSKIEKNILKQFKKITNEELLRMLRNAIFNVGIIMLSEKEAEKILLKYNRKFNFYKFNQTIKTKYFQLKECARLRGLKVPSEWFNVSITDEDIINRIKEVESEELRLIELCCRVIQGYYFDDDLQKVAESLSLNKQVEKTMNFYGKIIEMEFNGKKQLKKQS